MKGKTIMKGGGLAVGHCYLLVCEGEELVGWVKEVKEDMVWFRGRDGKEFGFTVAALNRMDALVKVGS